MKNVNNKKCKTNFVIIRIFPKLKGIHYTFLSIVTFFATFLIILLSFINA